MDLLARKDHPVSIIKTDGLADLFVYVITEKKQEIVYCQLMPIIKFTNIHMHSWMENGSQALLALESINLVLSCRSRRYTDFSLSCDGCHRPLFVPLHRSIFPTILATWTPLLELFMQSLVQLASVKPESPVTSKLFI